MGLIPLKRKYNLYAIFGRRNCEEISTLKVTSVNRCNFDFSLPCFDSSWWQGPSWTFRYRDEFCTNLAFIRVQNV